VVQRHHCPTSNNRLAFLECWSPNTPLHYTHTELPFKLVLLLLNYDEHELSIISNESVRIRTQSLIWTSTSGYKWFDFLLLYMVIVTVVVALIWICTYITNDHDFFDMTSLNAVHRYARFFHLVLISRHPRENCPALKNPLRSNEENKKSETPIKLSTQEY